MIEFWNDRYAEQEYAYGKQPNSFFKQELDKLAPGKILLPAEGEGRNAVYAAKLGWDVHAFDASEKGKEKAVKLSNENNVRIQYNVHSIQEFKTAENQYDAIALIFVHLPSELRQKFHKKLVDCLKPNGMLLLEAFSKKQLGKKSGGPQNIEMLYSLDEISNDFATLNLIDGLEKQIELSEGAYHQGLAEIIRIVVQKI